jgi:hypothetical protein
MAKKIPAVGEPNVGPFVLKVKKLTLGFSGADVNTGAVQGTYKLFNMPANSMLYDAWVYVRTAWTTSVTITIGDTENADGLFTSAKIAPTSAVTTGIQTSMTAATAGTYANGKRYDAAEDITAVIGGANPAAGLMDVFIVYLENVTAAV